MKLRMSLRVLIAASFSRTAVAVLFLNYTCPFASQLAFSAPARQVATVDSPDSREDPQQHDHQRHKNPMGEAEKHNGGHQDRSHSEGASPYCPKDLKSSSVAQLQNLAKKAFPGTDARIWVHLSHSGVLYNTPSSLVLFCPHRQVPLYQFEMVYRI